MLSPFWFVGMVFLIIGFQPGMEVFSILAICFFILSIFDMDY